VSDISADKIFRQAALDRLASPEQLDGLVRLTGLRLWIALATLLTLLAMAVAWGIFGSVPTRVMGKGILVNRGSRIVELTAPAAGQLTELRVQVGDMVAKGQDIGAVTQRDTEQKLASARSEVRDRTAELERLRAQVAREMPLRASYFEAQRSAYNRRIAAGDERKGYLMSRLAQLQPLAERHLVTQERVDQTRDQLDQTLQDIANAAGSLAQLEQQRTQEMGQDDQRVLMAERNLAEAQRKVSELEGSYERSMRIVAAVAGRVSELTAQPGGSLNQSQPVVKIETGGQGLDLMLYVPPEKGKQVKLGQSVQVAPSWARKEEYGTVVGQVEWVSDFPVSDEGLRTTLQNDTLVREYTKDGPPFAVKVGLERAPETVSGYRWTSEKGSALPLSSGTPANGEVTVKTQAPITLVIPLLKEVTGL
jgi:HlyD family secretion protein